MYPPRSIHSKLTPTNSKHDPPTAKLQCLPEDHPQQYRYVQNLYDWYAQATVPLEPGPNPLRLLAFYYISHSTLIELFLD